LLGGYNPPAGTGGGKKPATSVGDAFDTNLYSSYKMVQNLHPIPQMPTADVSYTLDIGVNGPVFTPGVDAYDTSDTMYMFTDQQGAKDVNAPGRTTWKKPQTPLLHTKGTCGVKGVPFITIEKNQTVELVINNLIPTAHVLHMHGMRFQVSGRTPCSS
jgi:FtsP/CotA-like multicopper oxidase with cupredoxin domain